MPCVASKTKQYPIRNSGLHTEIQRPSAGLAHTLHHPHFYPPRRPLPPFSSEPSLSKLHPLIGAHRDLASEMIACQVRPGLRPRRHHATPSLSADPPCFLVVWRPSHADAGRRTSHLLPAFAFARWPLKHRSASAPSEFCLQTPLTFSSAEPCTRKLVRTTPRTLFAAVEALLAGAERAASRYCRCSACAWPGRTDWRHRGPGARLERGSGCDGAAARRPPALRGRLPWGALWVGFGGGFGLVGY